MYKLKVVVENAASLAREDQTAFREIRRMGFGASDSSIILGVNPFPNSSIDELKKQKLSSVPTPDEIRIGNMSSVRKGIDVEPIIINHFEKRFGITVEKPEEMYNIEGTYLNVNYDGIAELEGIGKVPVEVKLMTKYGKKYYDMTKVIAEGEHILSKLHDPLTLMSPDIKAHIRNSAQVAGIPVYYYTQLQQQMMGLSAAYGFLAVMDDDQWKLKVFTVPADTNVWLELVRLSNIIGAEIF